MYTVKKIYAGDKQDGKFLLAGFAVVDSGGKVNMSKYFSGQMMYDIFDQKGTAQRQADFLNKAQLTDN